MSLRALVLAGLASVALSGVALADNSATVLQSGGGRNISSISQQAIRGSNDAFVQQEGRFNRSNITQNTRPRQQQRDCRSERRLG